MKRIQIYIVLFSWLSVSLMAVASTEIIDLKKKLTPIAQKAIAAQCGEGCTSFSIVPNFAVPKEGIENLGFGSSEPVSTDLKSVFVRIRALDSVSAEQREVARKAVVDALANELSVPVSARVENLESPPIAEKPEATLAETPVIDYFKALAWPLSLILLGLVALTALVMGLRHQLRLLQLKRQKAKDKNPTKSSQLSDAQAEQTKRLLEILESRAKDIAWYIEERVAQGDVESLGRMVKAFGAARLSDRIELSRSSLGFLREMTPFSGEAPAAEWVEATLEQSLWGRLLEEKMPLYQLKRRSPQQLRQWFSRLSSYESRAVFLTCVPQEQWAELISQLSSQSRIQLGVALSNYEGATLVEKEAAERNLQELLHESEPKSHSLIFERNDATLDYSLYLSETEGQSLWQQLSQKGRAYRPMSLEHLTAELSDEALLELCLRIEFENLSVLLRYSGAKTRDRIRSILPEALRARMGGQPATDLDDVESDPQFIKARAELVGMYRRLEQRGN